MHRPGVVYIYLPSHPPSPWWPNTGRRRLSPNIDPLPPGNTLPHVQRIAASDLADGRRAGHGDARRSSPAHARQDPEASLG